MSADRAMGVACGAGGKGLRAALLALALLSGCAHLQGPPAADLKARAAAAYTAERYGEAASAWRAYLEREPTDAEGWYRLGKAQVERMELRRAAAAFRRALELDPRMAKARHNLALVQIHSGVKNLFEARRSLPADDESAAATMRYIACLMEIFMGRPDPSTCQSPPPEGPGESP